MKNLLLIILLLAFSCKKESVKPIYLEQPQTSRGGSNYDWQAFCVTNDQITGHGIYGIKTTLTIKKLQATNYKAAFVSTWFGSNDGTYSGWAQVGYTSDMIAFWQGWLRNPVPHNVAIGIPQGSTATLLSSFKSVSAGEVHSFSLSLYNHVLDVLEDGIVKIRVDNLPADFMYNPEIAIESYGSSNKAPSFPVINFYPAFEYQTTENGQWTQAQSARSMYAASTSWWGAEGNIQNSLLKPNEVNMGSGIRTPLGTNLF